MVRDGALEKWMSFEMRRLRDSLVTQPRSLSDLMLEDVPTARTRAGEPHAFDKQMLERFHAALSPLTRRKLRLPITFYVDSELPNEAYVQDEAAATLLRALGEVPATLEPRAGRLWLSHARARDIAERWRGAFQFSLL